MTKEKRISTDTLATELHTDITRTDLSLIFRETVLTPLHSNTRFQAKCRGAYSHMAVATLTHTFMSLARMFDEPNGRFSVTLDQVVDRVADNSVERTHIKGEADQFHREIKTYRRKLARLRNNVFAHKTFLNSLPRVPWSDLEEGRDLAKKIMEWYGSEFGHAYSYRVPGFNSDCQRFLKTQIGGIQQLEAEGA